MNQQLSKLGVTGTDGLTGPIRVYNLKQPFLESEVSMKWDGGWHITLEVFRDLGLAFCVVMVAIYMLMVGWFRITPSRWW